MGFNTVAVILNDAGGDISRDGNFGRSLVSAMQAFSTSFTFNNTVAARGSELSVFCNAAEIISMGHADSNQFVLARGNTGWRITSDPNDGVPQDAIDHLERMLRDRRKAAKLAKADGGADGGPQMEQET